MRGRTPGWSTSDKKSKTFGFLTENYREFLNRSPAQRERRYTKGNIATKKSELTKIIKKYSLANQSPKLFDADPKTSVARGAVRLLSQ